MNQIPNFHQTPVLDSQVGLGLSWASLEWNGVRPHQTQQKHGVLFPASGSGCQVVWLLAALLTFCSLGINVLLILFFCLRVKTVVTLLWLGFVVEQFLFFRVSSWSCWSVKTYLFVCRSGSCHIVPVSEIISVREEDEENGSRRRDDGSWKKIKEREATDGRQAFTGNTWNHSKQRHSPHKTSGINAFGSIWMGKEQTHL